MKARRRIFGQQSTCLSGLLLVLIGLLPMLGFGQEANRGPDIKAATKPAFSGDVYALVVGISNYKYIQKLNYADDDAKAVARFLKEGMKAKMVLEFYDSMATGAAIMEEGLRAIEDMQREETIKPNDLVILYFAGHGGAFDKKTSYFFPYNAVTVTNKKSSIDILSIKSLCGTLRNADVQVLLIFDACRSATIDMSPDGIETANKFLSNDMFREIMMAASSQGEPAKEDPKLGHGVFTYYLLQGATGAADGVGGAKDNVVSATELSNYVNQNVASYTGEKQNPSFLPGDTKNARLFPVNEDVKLIAASLFNKGTSASGDGIGRGAEVIAQTEFQKYEVLFQQAINRNQLVKPEQANAFSYFMKMRSIDPKAKSLDGYRRKLLGLLSDFGSDILDNDIYGIRAYQRAVKSTESSGPVESTESTTVAQAASKPDKPTVPAATKAIAATRSSDEESPEVPREPTRLSAASPAQVNGDAPASAQQVQARTKSGYYLDYYRDAFLAQQAYVELGGGSEDSEYKLQYFKAKDLLFRYEENLKPELLEQAASILEKSRANTSYLQFAYAQALRKKGRLDNAIHELKSSSESSPFWTYPLVELADIYLYQKNNLDSSQYFIRKAITVNKNDPYPLGQIAEFYKSQSQYDSALKYFEKSIQADPLIDQPYINMGDFYTNTLGNRTRGVEYYERAYKINPRNSYLASSLAYFYQASGEREKAEKYFLDAIALDPTDGWNYDALTSIYLSRGEEEMAVELAGKAFRASPATAANSFSYLWGFASTSVERKQLKEEYVQRVTAVGSPDAYFNMGQTFQALGLEGDALDAFKRCYRADSTFTNCMELTGDILQRQGKNREAKLIFQRAIRIDAVNASSTFVKLLAVSPLAEQPILIGRYEKAIAGIGKQAGWSSLASTYVTLGKTSDAVRAYEKAVAIQPTEYDCRTLADLKFGQGKHADAIRLMRQAIHLDTLSVSMEGVSNFSTLSKYLSETGATQEAKLVLRQGIARFPEDAGEALVTLYDMATPAERIEIVMRYKRGIERIGTPAAYNKAASLFGQLKMTTEQEWCYRESLARDSSSYNSSTYKDMGSLYVDQGNEKEALGWYRKTIALDPTNGSTAFTMACNLLSPAERQELAVYYSRAVESTNDQLAFSNLGDGLDEAGFLLMASKAYEAAIERNATSWDCYHLGKIKFGSGNTKEAIRLLGQAIQLDTLDGTSNYDYFETLAGYLVADGNVAEAKRVLRRGLEWYTEYGANSFQMYWRMASREERVRIARAYEKLVSRLGTASGWTNLADVWKTLGSLEGAERCYRASLALDRSTNNQHTMESLGDVMVARGNLTEAKKWYTEAIWIDPPFASSPFKKLHDLIDRPAKAGLISKYQQTMHQIGTQTALVYLGDALAWAKQPEAAAEAYRKAIEILPLANTCIALAKLQHERGKLEDAVTLLREAIAKDTLMLTPSNEGFGLLSTYLIELGRIEEAKTIARRGYRFNAVVNTDLFSTYYSLMDEKGKREAAKEYEATLVKLRSAGAWSTLGDTYQSASSPELAEKAFRRSIHLDSTQSNAPAFKSLGDVLATLNKKEEAVRWYRRAMELDPESQAPSFKSLLSLQPSLKEKIVNDYESIIERKGTADAFEALGIAFEELDEKERAMRAYEKAVSSAPSANRCATLANFKDKLGHRAEAVALMERSIELDTLNGEGAGTSNHETLAAWLLEDGKVAASKKVLLSAMNSYPETAGNVFKQACAISSLPEQERLAARYVRLIRRIGTPSAWNGLAAAMREVNRHESAVLAYKESLIRDPGYDNTYTMDNAAGTYVEIGKLDLAKKLFKQSILIDPVNGYTAFREIWPILEEIERNELIKETSKAVGQNGSYLAYFNLGASLYNLGQIRQAVPYLEQAIRMAGVSSDYSLLSDANLKLGNRQVSTDLLRAALKVDTLSPEPGGSTYFELLAVRLEEDGKGIEAKQLLHRAWLRADCSVDAVADKFYSWGNEAEKKWIVEAYERRLRSTNGVSDSDWFDFAQFCQQRELHEPAQRGYFESLKQDSTASNLQAMEGLGDLLMEKGHRKDALAWYRKAIRLAPAEASTLFVKTWNLLGTAERSKLEADYSSLVSAQPKAENFSSLALALASIDRYSEAAAAYERAIALKPTSEDMVQLALIKYELLDMTAAIRWMEEAVRRDTLSFDPTDANFLQLASWWIETGKVSQGKKLLARSVYRNPEEAQAAFMKYCEHATLAEQQRLLMGYRKELGRRYSVSGFVSLGEVLSDKVAAEQCYRSALKINPDNQAALLALGGLLTELGRKQEAAGTYKRALKKYPEDPSAAFTNLWQITPEANRPALTIEQTRIVTAIGTASAFSSWGNELDGVGLHADAEAMMEKANSIEETPDILYQLAKIKRGLTKNEEAKTYLERAVRLDTSRGITGSMYISELASLYRSMNLPAEARKLWLELITRFPEEGSFYDSCLATSSEAERPGLLDWYKREMDRQSSAASYLTLAKRYQSMGQLPDAEAYMLKAIAKDSSDTNMEALVDLFVKQGKKAEASKVGRKLVEKGSGSQDLLKVIWSLTESIDEKRQLIVDLETRLSKPLTRTSLTTFRESLQFLLDNGMEASQVDTDLLKEGLQRHENDDKR